MRVGRSFSAWWSALLIVLGGGALVAGAWLAAFGTRMVGDVATDIFDPDRYLTNFMEGDVSTLPDGRTLRTFHVFAVNREIEIAPGVYFPAWTFNGEAPGPLFRSSGPLWGGGRWPRPWRRSTWQGWSSDT